MTSAAPQSPRPPATPRFRKLLLRAIVIPFLLMLGIAGVLVWQIEHLLATSAEVEHSDAVIANANHLQKLLLDLETGMRGYVITGLSDFLDPYNNAQPQLDAENQGLEDLVADNKLQHDRVLRIGELRRQWVQDARDLIQLRRQGGDAASVIRFRKSKHTMDAIREQFRDFIAEEERLRDQRTGNARRAAHYILGLAAAIALVGGAGLSFLSWRQFRELSRTYDAALQQVRDLNATLEQRVIQRTRELADANRELEAFSYSVSHDLRAPMRHVAGFADLLRHSAGPRLNADETENLTTIHDTARLAGRMVDDLLAFSRIGRTQLRYSDVDIAALVEQARRESLPDTAGRRIEWHIGALPHVQGDPSLLRLVVQNLLSNAVKYTGKIANAVIEVGSERVAGGIHYFVRDNGVGFDPDYASKLFGVFQRLHRAEEFEGTGIGLANVRRIIMRHGGRVWAEGSLSRGATFYFFLPSTNAEQVNVQHDDSGNQTHPPG